MTHLSPQARRALDTLPAFYRKRPTVVRALQWNGDNTAAVITFTQGGAFHVPFYMNDGPGTMLIQAFDGPTITHVGDYIIKKKNGEFSVCRPEIFEASYEKVDGDAEL